MRGPAPSFKDKLRSYSAHLDAVTRRHVEDARIRAPEVQRRIERASERLPKLGASGPDEQFGKPLRRKIAQQKPAKRRTVDQQFLHDLINDEQIEEIWAPIQASAPDTDDQQVIREILKLRGQAVAASRRIEASKNEREYWMNEFQSLLTKHVPLEELEKRLEFIGDGVYCLYLDELGHGDDEKISRKDQRGSRVVKLFVRKISRLFNRLCGEWCDYEVHILARIAFPEFDWGDDPEEQIRNWSRRPTTKAARRPKRGLH